MTTEHTPLEVHEGEDYIIVLKQGDTTDKPIARIYSDTDEEARKSANRIVRAYNSHDDLVGALRRISNEVHGVLRLEEHALRELISNTNYDILVQCVKQAIELLATQEEG